MPAACNARRTDSASRAWCRPIVAQVQELPAFDDVAAVTRGRGLENRGRDLCQGAFDERPKLEHVDRDAFCLDADTAAVPKDARARLVGEEVPPLRQAPAHRAAGIVGDFPQTLAQRLAAEAPRLQAQVGERRTGLPGRRQPHRTPAAPDHEVARESKFRHCHVRGLASSFGLTTGGREAISQAFRRQSHGPRECRGHSNAGSLAVALEWLR